VDVAHVTRTIEQLNEFARSNRARGVRVYYSHPPISQSGFEEAAEQIEFVAKLIAENLRIPLLNDVRQLVLPDSYFFDTKYHTTADGKALRTELLSDRLRTLVAPRDYGVAQRPGGRAPRGAPATPTVRR
jgi:hypothetical protein